MCISCQVADYGPLGAHGKGARDHVSSGLVPSWFLGCTEVKDQGWKAAGPADGKSHAGAGRAVSACPQRDSCGGELALNCEGRRAHQNQKRQPCASCCTSLVGGPTCSGPSLIEAR